MKYNKNNEYPQVQLQGNKKNHFTKKNGVLQTQKIIEHGEEF